MSPEVHASPGGQTPKADIWSLFVTLMWAMNVKDAHQLEADQVETDQLETGAKYRKIRAAIRAAANVAICLPFREMVDPDPASRASAAQMLVKLYNGEGLTTPSNKVPSLPLDS
jgi:hypothetical protein